MKSSLFIHSFLLLALATGCSGAPGKTEPAAGAIKPRFITEPTKWDTDDPAFWIPSDRTKALVVGTDKNSDGALYVYDLTGKIVQRVGDLKRPNNVDIAYGLSLGGKPVDIAHANIAKARLVPDYVALGLAPAKPGKPEQAAHPKRKKK